MGACPTVTESQEEGKTKVAVWKDTGVPGAPEQGEMRLNAKLGGCTGSGDSDAEVPQTTVRICLRGVRSYQLQCTSKRQPRGLRPRGVRRVCGKYLESTHTSNTQSSRRADGQEGQVLQGSPHFSSLLLGAFIPSRNYKLHVLLCFPMPQKVV